MHSKKPSCVFLTLSRILKVAVLVCCSSRFKLAKVGTGCFPEEARLEGWIQGHRHTQDEAGTDTHTHSNPGRCTATTHKLPCSRVITKMGFMQRHNIQPHHRLQSHCSIPFKSSGFKIIVLHRRRFGCVSERQRKPRWRPALCF